MHLPLYKALLAANISDEAATALVQAMDAHIESRVIAATQPVLAKLDSMQTTLSVQINALKEEKATAEKVKDARIKNWQWAAGWIVGGIGTGVTATLGIGKALGWY